MTMPAKKIFIEINSDFKPKMIRRRKEFVDQLLRIICEAPTDEAESDILGYGIKLIAIREPGDDLAVIVNGETLYRTR